MGWPNNPRPAKSLVVLRDQINAAYPKRSKVSDGLIGDAAHKIVASDHNPNAAGVVCAFDITHDPANGFDAHALANRLLAVRHPDLKYIISDGRIAGWWTDWKWTPYDDVDPHDTHIHVSVGVGDDGYSIQPYDDEDLWNVTEGGDMTIIANEHEARLCYVGLLHWPYDKATKQECQGLIGKTWEQVIGQFVYGEKNAADNDEWEAIDRAIKRPVGSITKTAVIDYLNSNLK